MNTDSSPIAAIATAPGRGGVGIVRISGKNLEPFISEFFRNATTELPLEPRYAHFLPFMDEDGSIIDEGIALYFKAPHSFTGEDVLELQGHGGPVVLQMLLKRCLQVGKNIDLRMAEPGEFTRRAFLNDRIDLAQAEAIADLIDATTEEAVRSASRSLSGAFSREIHELVATIIELRMLVESSLDFPEEDIPEDLNNDILNTVFKVKREINKHLQNNAVNERLRDGFKVVIAGKANAGKSSLVNALIKRNAVIVSDIAGTTRDSIDLNLDIKGYPVIITDTAGLRKTCNPIEKQGIDIAKQKIEEADIVLALYDATNEDDVQNGLFKDFLEKTIFIANKADKLSASEIENIKKKKHLVISAKYNQGLEALTNSIFNIIQEKFSSSSNYLITRIRYRKALEECLEELENFSLQKEIELAAEDIRLACRAIGKITGEVEVNEILDNIFGSFCIGK